MHEHVARLKTEESHQCPQVRGTATGVELGGQKGPGEAERHPSLSVHSSLQSTHQDRHCSFLSSTLIFASVFLRRQKPRKVEYFYKTWYL